MKTQFEQALKMDLRRDEQAIDESESLRLQAIRLQALDAHQTTTKAPRRFHGLLWPTAGIVLASLLVLITPLSPLTPPTSHEYLSDNFELYDELEFYYWLAESEPGLSG